MNPKLKALLDAYPVPHDIATECENLKLSQQRALANFLQYEVHGGDGFALRNRFEMDFYQFNHSLNALAAKILALRHPVPDQAPSSAIFGTLGKLDDQITLLRNHGYLVSDHSLPAQTQGAIRDEIAKFSFYEKKPGSALRSGEELYRLGSMGEETESGTFWLKDLNEATHNPLLSSLAFDPYILSMVTNYFGCTPVHVQTNIWLSFAGKGDKSQLSASAQLYHQDKEFTKFLKVFIYLTDVRESNGPHCYVDGSHIDELFTRGVPFSTRLTDENVLEYFDAHRLKTVTGPAGTIIFGDTSAVHKGLPVKSGYRCMLQFEYAASLYMSPIEPFEDLSPAQYEAIAQLGAPARLLQNYDSLARNRYKATFDQAKPATLLDRIRSRIVQQVILPWRLRQLTRV
ncbi:hypothetical protein AVE30378_03669 [Achromobacter veterisilvae]|uniref:Uncharacterized protein n=1 Tax=Achromobacter veterisilvae TaxID=2069367 RepID=A0A446CP41_9BURK|nr:phytanoyl-CoA dioxygenase family protein [Achromobacter veterisilvae]SSW69704.1 hypothetical protein AVE30378_03669 [Achromobacter veterisilvae]